MFHRDRWTVCAQIEFGFNCIVAFYNLSAPQTLFTALRGAHLLSFSFPLISLLLLLPSFVCICEYVSVRCFFILHYSRIKDTVIL